MQVESSLAARNARRFESADLLLHALKRLFPCRLISQMVRALLGLVVAAASSSSALAQQSEIVSDQCTPLTTIRGGSNGDIQLWQIGEVIRTQVVITFSQGIVRGEAVYTDYQRLSWVPTGGYQINGACRIIEARYYNFAPGPSMGGEFAASGETTESRRERIVRQAVRRFIRENQNWTPNDGTQCGAGGIHFFGKCRYPLYRNPLRPPCPDCPRIPGRGPGAGVQGSLDAGGGGWLSTASPAHITFHTDVLVGESETYIPFLIDQAGIGDAITIYGASGVPVWTRYLADLKPGELYFAAIPQQLLATAGLPIFTIWLHGTGASPSRVLIPDTVDFWDPPIAVPAVAGALGAGGWYVSDVAVSWSVSDPQGLPITSRTGCDATTIAFDTPALDVMCRVATEAGESWDTLTIRRDATPPSISISTPSGQTVTQGTPLVAAYTCADAMSGLQSCVGTVANGAPLDTTALGTRTLVVTATDAAGNTASAGMTYTVIAANTDSDGDGVPDSADLCPGTPRGTVVGANGCPVLPPPAAGCDVNGDNFIDYRDIRSIVLGIGRSATGSADPRDANVNGRIDVIDAAICTSRCSRLLCLPPR